MIRKFPAIFLLAFVVGGIVTADLSHWPSWLFILSALAAGLGGLLFLTRSTTVVSSLLLACSLGSVVAVHFALTSYDFGNRHIARIIDEDRVCHIFGRVTDWPELKVRGTEITVAVDSLGGDISRQVDGAVLIKVTDTTTALQIGDRIEFHARIYPIRREDRGGGFDYGRYLRMKGISGVVYLPTLLDVRIDRRYQYGFFAFTDQVRNWITDCFRRNLRPDHAALASGFLIGETRDIPAHVYRQFRQSGTLHLLAVSGSNVALVLLVCVVLLRPFRLSRRQRGAVLLVLLFLFTVISYGQPSVIRASVMAGLVIIAGMLERRYDLNNLIALSAVLILAIDPGELYDVGFQLSYATAWGLVFIVPKLTALSQDSQSRRWYHWVVFPVIVSLVAQVVSTPLILLYFGQAPLLSLPANLVIVPLTGVAVVGVMVLAIADLILPVLGLSVGSLASLVLEAVLRAVELFGSPELPSLKLTSLSHTGIAVIVVLVAYMLLILATFAIKSKIARRALVWIVIGGCLSGLAYGLSPGSSQGTVLRLTTIPGGVAAVRITEGSRSADLIISGGVAREYSVSERIILPWLTKLGVERLDQCFVLAADYASLGDILSLQDSIPTTQFHVPYPLRQSATDVLTHSGRTAEAKRINYFGGVANPKIEHLGYHASAHGLYLRLRDGGVLFPLNDLRSAIENAQGVDFVVIGGKVSNLPPADSLELAGVHGVICAKYEQKPADGNLSNGHAVRVTRADFWIDLRAKGEVVMQLSDSVCLVR